jgi:Ca2+-transporting ATPase
MIYEHIRQFVVYLLSCNLAEIISVGMAAVLNFPSPLLPLQILFLNLVTDVFPALALGMGKGEKDIMQIHPRKPDEPLMTPKLWTTTVVLGLSITIAVLGLIAYTYLILKLSSAEINNMAFYTLIIAQLLNVFSIPRNSVSFLKNEVTSNPWIWGAIALSVIITFLAYSIPAMANTLSLIPISGSHMGIAVIFGFSSLVISQLFKRIGRMA